MLCACMSYPALHLHALAANLDTHQVTSRKLSTTLPAYLRPLPVLDHAGKEGATRPVGLLPEAGGHSGQHVISPQVVTLPRSSVS